MGQCTVAECEGSGSSPPPEREHRPTLIRGPAWPQRTAKSSSRGLSDLPRTPFFAVELTPFEPLPPLQRLPSATKRLFIHTPWCCRHGTAKVIVDQSAEIPLLVGHQACRAGVPMQAPWRPIMAVFRSRAFRALSHLRQRPRQLGSFCKAGVSCGRSSRRSSAQPAQGCQPT